VRLQATHLHIDWPLIDDEDEEPEEPRADALAMVERLAMIMSLQWPEVVEVRGDQQGTLLHWRACHGRRRIADAAGAMRACALAVFLTDSHVCPAVQVTIHLSAAAVAAPLSLVMFRLPALQRLTVMGGRGTGPGLADACRIIANLGTRLESLEMYDLHSVFAAGVSRALAPLTALTGERGSNWGAGILHACVRARLSCSLPFVQWGPSGFCVFAHGVGDVHIVQASLQCCCCRAAAAGGGKHWPAPGEPTG
jgi:hypothetical protein